MPIKVYASADGLGSSYINNLMRDSRGFLWVCTRDGLSRFHFNGDFQQAEMVKAFITSFEYRRRFGR
ncbi:MAG TPA: two-component regulator propeller domain-containing protein [Pyrinomonadaceae bacterium]|nr:two-component regulator propeller domain-containing protein [Pyrinomonadaceae bacterium]